MERCHLRRAARRELDVNESKFFAVVGRWSSTKNGMMSLAQVLERTMVPDECRSAVTFCVDCKRRIDEAEMAELGQRADSLNRVLRNGGDFDDLVQRFSGDPGSKSTGGASISSRGRMVKPFEDFCFDKQLGRRRPYGNHLRGAPDRSARPPQRSGRGACRLHHPQSRCLRHHSATPTPKRANSQSTRPTRKA